MDKDLDMLAGAKNAIRNCLGVKGSDQVFIVTDSETEAIGKALEAEVGATGARVALVRLEEFGARPMSQFPEALAKQVNDFTPSVTIYAAGIRENELAMRSGLINLAHNLGARHAHMPAIVPRIMREGMTTDANEINRLTRQVYEIVRKAKAIHVTASDGTDLTAHFDENLKWVPSGGLLHHAGDFGNLPDGEVFTSPAGVEGVFLARVLGDYFSAKYGVLSHPVRIEIKDSLVQKADCKQTGVANEFLGYLNSTGNGKRVGEFAIGTNTGVKALIGSMLQDEKIPGVHIAFGSPLGNQTGATWTSSIHVDVVNPGCSVEVDGRLLMKDGVFTLS